MLCAGDIDTSEQLATRLTCLLEAMSAAVPSVLSVTLTLVRDGSEVAFAVATDTGSLRPVLSSLAAPMPAGGPGALLVVRAATAGAFASLSAQAVPWIGLGVAGLQLDQHLVAPLPEPDAALAKALAALRSIHQGLGALIEGGLEPDAALREIARLAETVESTMAAASRVVLAELPPTRAPVRDP